MITAIIILSCLNLTIIQCLKKWGVLDYYSAKFGHLNWLPKADCYLCLSFWLTFITGPIYCLLSLYDLEFILLPFICAGIVNILQTLHESR
jgi:hypothetical protein